MTLGAVEQAAVASRKDGARADLVKLPGRLVGGIVVGAVALWVSAFKTGQTRGEASGRDVARQQCGYMAAAMSWGNSAERHVAHRLADAGSIRNLASCDMPGWEPTRDGVCLVPVQGQNTWLASPTGREIGNISTSVTDKYRENCLSGNARMSHCEKRSSRVRRGAAVAGRN
jgi:hypothetical protein